MRAAALARRLTAIELTRKPPPEWGLAHDRIPDVHTTADWEDLAQEWDKTPREQRTAEHWTALTGIPANDNETLPPGVVWGVQYGPQALLLSAALYNLVDIIYYGGARGGGKTDGALGLILHHVKEHGKTAYILVLRRSLDELEQIIQRSQAVFGKIPGAHWHGEKNRRWTIDGAIIRFRYLERDEDAQLYQGHGYTLILVEEVGNFPTPSPIFVLLGALRSGAGVQGVIVLLGNPGGAGQSWLKNTFIDKAPLGNKIIEMIAESGHALRLLFIPSKLEDNKILMRNDPGYEGRLHFVGSKALVQAWRHGDHSIVVGAYFDCWSKNMIIRPVDLPAHWTRFRSMDWGSAKPFSIGWWAVSDGTLPQFPAGALIRYREWYGVDKKHNGDVIPNVGIKLPIEAITDGIVERSQGETYAYDIGGIDLHDGSKGPSLAERMYERANILWLKADTARKAGWDQLRSRMIGIDGRPMIVTFDTNVDSIRTIPALQHDKIKAEDVDRKGEDHAGDDWRYAAMSRPWESPPQALPTPKIDALMTLNNLLDHHDRHAGGKARL